MRIEPAHIEQIRQAEDGSMVLVSSETSTIAADLHDIDPCLKLRLSTTAHPPFWAVYWESPDRRETYLVSTFTATIGRTGMWTGLDDRIVQHIREIDPQSRKGYNYAKALEERREARERAEKHEREERAGEMAERLAHALRRDLGQRYLGRAFITRKP